MVCVVCDHVIVWSCGYDVVLLCCAVMLLCGFVVWFVRLCRRVVYVVDGG